MARLLPVRQHGPIMEEQAHAWPHHHITTALSCSGRQFHLCFAVGLTSLAIVVGWVAFEFGYQFARNQGQPIVIVVHTTTL